MIAYLRNSVWDYVLCCVASWALAFTACSCFYASQPYQQDALGVLAMVGVCAVFTAALFVVSLNTRTLLVGVPVLAIAVIGVLAACFAANPGASVLDDVPGNAMFFAICTMAPTAIVFLLSRWRGTTVLLIVGGVLLCAVVEYLYWYGHVVSAVAFVVAAAALYVYRAYQRSVMASDSERLAFGSVTLAGVALVALSCLAAFGVFAAVIAPLDPPHLVVKLVTEHYRIEEIEVRGIGDVSPAFDDSLVSNVMSSVTAMTDTLDEQMENRQNNDDVGEGEAEDESMGLDDGGVQDTPVGSGLASLSLIFKNWLVYLVIGAIVLLVVAAILVKRALRARRYRAMVAGGNDAGAEALYRFFLDRFRRLKIPQPEANTLGEYAANFNDAFCRFEETAGRARFADVTDAYVRRVYGNEAVSDEEFSLFEDYYRLFYKRMRRYAGRVRYCLMFFFV